MRSALPSLFALVPLAAALLVSGADEDPPSTRDVREWVEEYVALDGRSSDGIARQDELLARFERVPPLDERDVKTWSKRIEDAWEDGPELERKSGRHYIDEEAERGLYLVRGETRRPKALFVGFHGGGAGAGDAGESAAAWGSAASSLDWVGIFPEVLEKTEYGWTDAGTEEFVLELVERAFRTWRLDRDRVFFGGHSMGGYGTWTLGAHHADRVAGLAPSAGAPTPVRDATGAIVDVIEGVIPNLRSVPLVIYQSDDDANVPPDANRAAVEALERARERWGGYDFEYWEVSGRGHDFPPGGARALLEKIAERVREPRPDTVVWQPTLAWKRQFYWLWWDEPVIGAVVVAKLDPEANAVRFESEAELEGLHALLDGERLDLEREVVVFVNGEERWRGVPERRLSVLVATGGGVDPGRTFLARVPAGGS